MKNYQTVIKFIRQSCNNVDTVPDKQRLNVNNEIGSTKPEVSKTPA